MNLDEIFLSIQMVLECLPDVLGTETTSMQVGSRKDWRLPSALSIFVSI